MTRTPCCSRSASSARLPTTATSTAPGADLPVAELASFVGRYVVRALAADEEIAARVLGRSAKGTGGAPDHRPARSALCPDFAGDAWMDEAKKIRDEVGDSDTPPVHKVRMNLVIVDCPDGVGTDGTVDTHMDTSGGQVEMDLGHLDEPDLTVTADYETAKAIFVDQNPQAGMQAFMSGKIKVQGDMAKLMAMQQGRSRSQGRRDRCPHPSHHGLRGFTLDVRLWSRARLERKPGRWPRRSGWGSPRPAHRPGG